MREIKFRAWDECDKRMLTSECVDLLIDLQGRLNSHDLGILNGYDNTPQYPLMQYTGLKDRNGKEIYEGDILEYKKLSFHENGLERGFVWYTEYAEWSVNSWLLNKIFKRSEIVGNICEDPELIEHE